MNLLGMAGVEASEEQYFPSGAKAVLLAQSSWTRTWPTWAHYLSATLTVLIAWGIRVWIGSDLPGHPFELFFLAIVLVSVLFDRRTGYYAALLSAALSAYSLLMPIGGLAVDRGGYPLALALFVITGLMTAFIIEALRAALSELGVAHEQIAASEREKDLMLREMVHRTKNDLSILHSLFLQQSTRTTEPEARQALLAAAERVQVMGRVHERLTRHGREALADTRNFISALCEDLRAALVGQRPIVIRVEAESHSLPLGRAVPVGLIINELLTNALKYAFPEDRGGNVVVGFFRRGDDFYLIVSDNGVGIASARAKGTGLGQRLVRSLATQLGGTVEVESDATGTRVIARFPPTRNTA